MLIETFFAVSGFFIIILIFAVIGVAVCYKEFEHKRNFVITEDLYNLDTDMLKILNIALDSVGTTDEKIKEDKLNQIKSILSVSENEQQDKEAGNDDNHEKESLELC